MATVPAATYTMSNRLLTGPRIGLALGLLSAAAVCLWLALSGPDPNRVQHLEDGSLFCLRRISFNNTNVFTHGNWLERNLGNVIPSKGINLGPLHLQRRTYAPFHHEDTRGLILEFERLTTNAPSAPRGVRCVVVGDDGSQYPAEFHLDLSTREDIPSEYFHDAAHPIQHDFFGSSGPKYPDGEFEYFVAPDFPRASAWLTLRFERTTNSEDWEPLASFKIKNPLSAPSKPRPWHSTPTPLTNEIDGLRFVLNNITAYPTQLGSPWTTDSQVTISLQVQSNGIALPNWRVFSVRLEDALGNTREWGHPFRLRNGWLTLDDNLFLDPKQTWKFEADLASVANISKPGIRDPLRPAWDQIVTEGLDPECLCTIRIPPTRGASFLTNVHNVPLRITQSRSDTSQGQKFLGHRFEIVADDTGRRILNLSWDAQMSIEYELHRAGSRQVDFIVLDQGTNDVELTFALVKNYHLEFLVKPTLTDRPPPPPGKGPRP